jgi:hypothetical protein
MARGRVGHTVGGVTVRHAGRGVGAGCMAGVWSGLVNRGGDGERTLSAVPPVEFMLPLCTAAWWYADDMGAVHRYCYIKVQPRGGRHERMTDAVPWTSVSGAPYITCCGCGAACSAQHGGTQSCSCLCQTVGCAQVLLGADPAPYGLGGAGAGDKGVRCARAAPVLAPATSTAAAEQRCGGGKAGT